jgi:multidrug efflux pump subunit AcrB
MKKFVEYFLNNSLIVNLFSVALIVAGLLFIAGANREAFPNVDFGWVLVQTVYPGATASDVEKLISKPIEDELREVSTGIDEVSSSSVENVSVVAVKLEADLANKQKVIQDIQDAVDKVSDLPQDAETPEVIELNTSEIPVLRISILTRGGISTYEDELEIREYVKALKDRLINLPGAAKIETIGYRDREMHVEVDIDKLDQFHIALNDITYALSNENINFPGGIAKENNEDVLIRTIGEFQTADEIENMIIRSNDIGELVKIRDVASVKETFESEDVINKTNSYKSLTLTVLLKEGYDIITLVDQAKEVVAEYKATLPEKYDVVLTNDFSFYVKNRLDVLKGNGLIGIVLVVLSLLVTLGWRISIVTSIGLPIAFAGTFWMMGIQGVSINLISMFGLIMVLGMLVDDAIIVSENIYRHLEHGEKLKAAVINGTSEVIIPVAGTILTTIAAFAPLLFMGGVMGKFMWALPAVVSIALTMSWLESMLILPSHIYDMEKFFRKGKEDEAVKKPKNIHEVKHSPLQIRKKYVTLLAFVLKNRIKFLFGLSFLFIFTLGFVFSGIIKMELFPSGGIETFVVLAEAPNGTSISQMEEKIKKIETVIDEMPDVYIESYITRVGLMAQSESDPDTKSGSKYASIIVHLTPFKERRDLGKEAEAASVVNLLRESSKEYHKEFAEISFQEIADGPPTDAAISINIQGEDIETLKEIGEKYKAFLRTQEGVIDIEDSFESEKKEFRVFVNQEIATRAGISTLDVAFNN